MRKMFLTDWHPYCLQLYENRHSKLSSKTQFIALLDDDLNDLCRRDNIALLDEGYLEPYQ